MFKAAYSQGLSIAAEGTHRMREDTVRRGDGARSGAPLITVSCHDDLTTADLVGRFLLRGGDTEWVDGPLTRAVREGAICYLDEVVEARQDTTVVLHPLVRPPASAADRAARRHSSMRARVLPGGVVQPRLSERAEGSQGLDASADGRHRIRFPSTRCGGEDRHLRGRHRARRAPHSWSGSARRSAG